MSISVLLSNCLRTWKTNLSLTNSKSQLIIMGIYKKVTFWRESERDTNPLASFFHFNKEGGENLQPDQKGSYTVF